MKALRKVSCLVGAAKLDKDGAVKEVLLHPTTKMGTCAGETLLKSTFSAPPKAAYWVNVFMKLTHHPLGV